MISNELRNLILPNLKMHLPEDAWQYIDIMFTEGYESYIEGMHLITLQPYPGSEPIAMQFDKLTGTFVEITDWDYIKKVGKLV